MVFPESNARGNRTQSLEPLVSGIVATASFAIKHLRLSLRTDDLLPYSQLFLTTIGAIVVALFASSMAARAAIEWGSMVKGATDVFLPALYERLGFLPPASRNEVEERWNAFSDAITYRIRNAMPFRRWTTVPTDSSSSSLSAIPSIKSAPPPNVAATSGNSASLERIDSTLCETDAEGENQKSLSDADSKSVNRNFDKKR